MTNTQTPETGITPEVGKRYVTRGGWVTPPMEKDDDDIFPYKSGIRSYRKDGRYFPKGESDLDLISEYVEPTAPPDTFRRDLIARLYVAMVGSSEYTHLSYTDMATHAIAFADTLIKAMEGEV